MNEKRTSFGLLLVDDETAFVEALAQRLERRGFPVRCAFSADEALRVLDTDGAVDVVVLDIRMPGRSGVDTVQTIKGKYPLVEVVMLTGHADVESAVATLKSGAFDYLIKPCAIEDLIAKATDAAARKKDREARIHDEKIRPYISERERAERISRILDP